MKITRLIKERKMISLKRIARTVMILSVIFVLSFMFQVEIQAAEGFDQVAGSSDMAAQKEVEKYGMVPIYGHDLADGSYEIQVNSSSPFFRIEKAVLNVKDGKMDAVMTMSSYSYDYIYMGTAEDAAQAEFSDYIKYKKQSGYYTFSIEVPYLNHKFNCAAFSNRKQKWYNRYILFDAGTLDKDALSYTVPDYDKIEKAIEYYNSMRNQTEETKEEPAADSSSGVITPLTPAEAMAFDADDGEYSIELNMTGGSGRASISSPTLLVVKDGKAYAELIWSSTYYDYMIVGGKTYDNLSEDGGNSRFLIPIPVMDESFPVIGDTTAMGDPVEIEYELTFYSESIGSKSMIPQEAAKRVLLFGIVIMIVGGIINHFFKKSRFK